MSTDQEILKQVYNACSPGEPASREFYVDCAPARGSGALTQEFQRHLSLTEEYRCFLFSGHIGCGKSSELASLKRSLSNADPANSNDRYFPVLLNVSDYLDDYDVSVTDILLAIVSEVSSSFRTELGIELKDSFFSKRFAELKQFLLTEVELKEGEISLGFAKAKVQRLKRDGDARGKVRAALAPAFSTMLEEINVFFDQARTALANLPENVLARPYKDIVLILDNLEKIRKLAGIEEGLPSQRELFLERYAQLTGMKAHVIYTVPLRLARSPDGPNLISRYGSLFVLPMVKVIEKGTRNPYRGGVRCLNELLQRRLGDNPIDDVIAPDALDFLLTYSGGNMRHLMTFIQQACSYSTFTPISLPAARRAIQQLVRTYSTSIPEGHWQKLASLDASSDQQLPNDDREYLTMLETLSVLEYVNGVANEDPFAAIEPWYGVHPIVRELQKFKAARAALSIAGPRSNA